MSNEASIDHRAPISIVFFGRRCPFTTIPFERLARAGIDIRALILSSPAPAGPPVRLRRYRPTISFSDAHPSLDQIAGERGIPLFDVRRPLGDELRAILRQQSPDLLVAACFPWRISREVLSEARLGGVNLHPSPLPRFRGPDPLFWAYRLGEHAWGVTAHQISESFDAGAILAQAPLEIPTHMAGDELERRCATIGTKLLQTVIEQMSSGALISCPQCDSDATYQSWPNAAQLVIERDWTIEHVLHFVRGVRPLGYEPAISTVRGWQTVRSAQRAIRNANSEETWLDERTVRIALTDGAVEFTLA